MDILCLESTARPIVSRREDQLRQQMPPHHQHPFTNIMIIAATDSEDEEASPGGPYTGFRLRPTHLSPVASAPAIISMGYTIQLDGTLVMDPSENQSTSTATPNPSSRRQRQRRMIEKQKQSHQPTAIPQQASTASSTNTEIVDVEALSTHDQLTGAIQEASRATAQGSAAPAEPILPIDMVGTSHKHQIVDIMDDCWALTHESTS